MTRTLNEQVAANAKVRGESCRFLQSKWQSDWNKQTSNKLNGINPNLGPPFIVYSSRKDQVVINRIRIGHTRLTHSYLMEQENEEKIKPKCQYCNNHPLTVKHIIIECTYFTAIRSNYFNACNMKDLFDNVDVNNILSFLKETLIYQKI